MQSMTCVYWHKPCARDFKSKRLTFKQLNQMGKHNADIVFRPFFDLNSDAIFMGLWLMELHQWYDNIELGCSWKLTSNHGDVVTIVGISITSNLGNLRNPYRNCNLQRFSSLCKWYWCPGKVDNFEVKVMYQRYSSCLAKMWPNHCGILFDIYMGFCLPKTGPPEWRVYIIWLVQNWDVTWCNQRNCKQETSAMSYTPVKSIWNFQIIPKLQIPYGEIIFQFHFQRFRFKRLGIFEKK
jgi:hypothetical protein